MSFCRIVDSNYKKRNRLIHFNLASVFQNLVINDKVCQGKWDETGARSIGYSVLVYFENVDYLIQQNLYVDYVNGEEFPTSEALISHIIKLYRTFKQSIERHESVVVWDLDETLINDDGTLTSEDLIHYLLQFKKHFKRMVVWSHGDPGHVIGHLKRLRLYSLFDIVITRSYHTSYGFNKGIGFVLKQLNRKFKTTMITYSCLVDDKPSNYIGDYTFYLRLNPKERDHSRAFKTALSLLPDRIDLYFNHGSKMFGNLKYL
ncbi:Orf10 [Heliothis zea nudivirus]|uniref:Baculovirus 38k protein n=2 Tax=Betanudivirus hezeae TaxID=3052000 RepID=G9I0D4_HZNV2|nr:Orf10 [Heliothis zea nudivirus]YP_004956856.1 orf108 gene product [Helicoverpa zea nudivirus 2]AAN04447.1 Orf10 [Heliothis zea nudivirus]AEW69657.1 baculovirus 38k protein [Helicoverpa zea nudivirus 2]WCZ68585.1 baculovirus 38k protein [Heliothis virescens nudivirus]